MGYVYSVAVFRAKSIEKWDTLNDKPGASITRGGFIGAGIVHEVGGIDMGASLNVAFDKKVSPFGTLSDDHNALGNGLERLDKVLQKAGLPTLGQFVSMDPAEWADMDDDDPDAAALPKLRWFKPADGLAAVRAAAAHLEAKQKAHSWSAAALDELREVETELAAAEKRKAKFRFEIGD